MKITFHILLTMGLLMMIGCQTGLTKSEGISDAELIQAIIDADKTEISLEQLPAQSRMIMEHDYYLVYLGTHSPTRMVTINQIITNFRYLVINQ